MDTRDTMRSTLEEETESLIRTIRHETRQSHTRRFNSLDCLRGLGICLMIICTESNTSYNHVLDSAKWDGIGFADLIPPLFLFVMGFSTALSYNKFMRLDEEIDDGDETSKSFAKKSFIRGIKLVALGLILQGGTPTTTAETHTDVPQTSFFVNLPDIRLCGILQRFGFVSLLLGLFIVYTPISGRSTRRLEHLLTTNSPVLTYTNTFKYRRYSFFIMILVIILFLVLSFEIQVTDHPNCKAGMHSIECNVASFFDRAVFKEAHFSKFATYQRDSLCENIFTKNNTISPSVPPDLNYCLYKFEPWGILSTLPSLIVAFIGFHFGDLYLDTYHFSDQKQTHKVRLQVWFISSITLIIFGIILHFNGYPFNRNLFTLSFAFFATGISGISLVVLYILSEVLKSRSIEFLQLLGRNSLLIFIIGACKLTELLLECVYWNDRHNNNIIHLFKEQWLKDIFGDFGNIFFSLIKILVWIFVSWRLKKMGFFFTI